MGATRAALLDSSRSVHLQSQLQSQPSAVAQVKQEDFEGASDSAATRSPAPVAPEAPVPESAPPPLPSIDPVLNGERRSGAHCIGERPDGCRARAPLARRPVPLHVRRTRAQSRAHDAAVASPARRRSVSTWNRHCSRAQSRAPRRARRYLRNAPRRSSGVRYCLLVKQLNIDSVYSTRT